METEVKDFAKTFGELNDNGFGDFKVVFNRTFFNGEKGHLDFENFVIDSLADIGHSDNVVIMSLNGNKAKGLTVKGLLELFNRLTEHCNDFTVTLRHGYDDGSGWGFAIDDYVVDLNDYNICSGEMELTFSIELE